MAATLPKPPARDERTLARDAERSKIQADVTGEEAARYRRLEELKDKLAAEGIVLADHDSARVFERAQEWNSSLRPINAFELWLLEKVAETSLGVDACDKAIGYRRALRSRRAETVEIWRTDRRAEVAKSAREFASEWTVLVPQLKTSAAGIEWLLSRWLELRELLDVRGNWVAPQRLLACKLQGKPIELIVTDPVENGTAKIDDLRALCDREIASLRGLLADGLFHVDEIERLAVVTGQSLDDSSETKALLKLRSQHASHLKWLLAQFKKGRLDHDPSAKKPSSSKPVEAPTFAPVAPVEPISNGKIHAAESVPSVRSENFLSKAARRVLETTQASFSPARQSAERGSRVSSSRDARGHDARKRLKGRVALA